MLRKHRALIAGLALLSAATTADAAVVISQVYGGGGGSGATTTYKNDYIELFNTGTSPVTLTGYSVQYGAATGTAGWNVHSLPTLTIPAGGYVLLQEGTAGTAGAALPTPDATGGLNLSATAGKVALVSSTTALNGACPTTNVVDQVGFGTANCSETAATGALSVTTAAIRKSSGCTDSNNNSADFDVTTPAPRNSASAVHACTAPLPTISVDTPSVAEGNSGTTTLTFTVSLSAPAPSGGVGFVYNAVDGTATVADGDYVTPSGAGNIPSGGTSTTVDVTVNGDTKFEGNETLTLQLIGVTNATPAVATGTGTIINDDAAPTLTIADVTVAEGNSGTTTATFTVTQSAVSGLPTTFDIATADDTATAGSDYAAASQTGVTIAAGATTATFDVTVNGDTVAEPNETFFANVTNASGASIADGQAVGTIMNDDVAVTPSLSINNVTVTEGNSGTVNATFTITSTLPAPPPGITVDVATADDTATTADGDYVLLTTTVTIPPLLLSTTVTVQVNGDTKIEPNEMFFVNLSNPTNGAVIGDGQGVGTITNDDVPPDLSIGDASVTEGNSGTAQLTFPITLSAPAPAGGIDFVATTTDGTATAPSDYVALGGRGGNIPAGATSGSVIVTVNGDTAYEANETFTVTLSGVTNANVTDGTATGTITNDDFLEIHDIQGSGLATTLTGTVETHENIVTGKGPQGFTMQAPDARADGDINTSEGIYVFTSTAPTVAVGDKVNVTGTVSEFNGLTEISFATVTLVSPGNPLPTPVEFNATVPSQDPNNPTCVTSGSNFECFESMRVHIADGLANTGNQRFASPATETFAEVFITADGRRGVREPGILYPLLPTAGNMAAGQWDGNPEMFELDADYFGAVPVDTPIYGGTHFTATGVMGYDFGDYELWATEFNVTQAPEYPRPVRDAGAASNLRIGAFNMLRFCDTVNSGTGADPCVSPTPTQAVFDAKVARLAAYVKDVLKLPDVLGTEEVENLTALDALAAKLSQVSGVPYVARLEEGNDIGGIDVGFLIRTDRVSITNVTQLGKTVTWNDPTGSPTALLNDRPPLLLEGTFTGGGSNQPFAVMVVHPKARSCTDQPGGSTCAQADVDRNRQKRFLQGKDHAQRVQDYQTAHPTVPLMVVGDFNAYQFTDGWTDVVGLIAGTYDDAANLLDLGPNIVVPALWNAVTSLPLNEQYSFLFTENFGQFQGFNTRDVPTQQVLDNALLNKVAKSMFVGFDYGRADEDAPNEVERQCNLVPTPAPPACPNPAIGVSDHDGFVFVLITDRIFKDGFDPAN